jgi:hypothetical protein
MTRCLRVLILIGPALLWHVTGTGEARVSVRGHVSTLDYGFSVLLTDATIEFRSADGATLGYTIATMTNEAGVYSASLEPGLDYTVTVTKKGFCRTRRPFFRVNPGSTIRFDFTLTTQCPGDRWVVGAPDKESFDDAYFDSPLPYYFEEEIALAKSRRGRSLMIVFGTRRKGPGRVEYSSLPIKAHPEDHLPVTISFDTYTVRSDTAVLDRNTRVLRAEGHVSVEDGSDSAPVASPCVALQLEDSELRPRPCAPGNTTDVTP